VSVVLFVFYWNMRQALMVVDQPRLTALRLLGAGRARIAKLLIVPSSIPYLLAALRIAVPLAFASSIFAELRIPTDKGLGTILNSAATRLDTDTAMCLLLFVVLIGYLLDRVVGGWLGRNAAS